LPSGRLVRGRGSRTPPPAGQTPSLGVYLQCTAPTSFEWETRWIRWPDFWLPSDRTAFTHAVHEVLHRCVNERVEIACGSGYGRTGTALACLVVADGLQNKDAVDYVRRNYSRRAVETPWQKRFVTSFRAMQNWMPAPNHVKLQQCSPCCGPSLPCQLIVRQNRHLRWLHREQSRPPLVPEDPHGHSTNWIAVDTQVWGSHGTGWCRSSGSDDRSSAGGWTRERLVQWEQRRCEYCSRDRVTHRLVDPIEGADRLQRDYLASAHLDVIHVYASDGDSANWSPSNTSRYR